MQHKKYAIASFRGYLRRSTSSCDDDDMAQYKEVAI